MATPTNCSRCGAPVTQPGSRFCMACGASLAPSDAAPTVAPITHRPKALLWLVPVVLVVLVAVALLADTPLRTALLPGKSAGAPEGAASGLAAAVTPGATPAASQVPGTAVMTPKKAAATPTPAPTTSEDEAFLATARRILKAEEVSSLVQLEERERLRFGRGRLEDVIYSPTGDAVAVATGLGVWIYGLVGNVPARLLAHPQAINTVSWSPDGVWLATGGRDELIRLWDASTGTFERTLPGCRYNMIDEVEWAPDGSRLAAVCNGAYVIDPATGQAVRLDATSNSTEHLAWSPDGRQLALVGRKYDNDTYSGEAGIWDADTGKMMRTLIASEPGLAPEDVDWSPNGLNVTLVVRYVSGTQQPNGITRWSVTGSEVRTYRSDTGELTTQPLTEPCTSAARWSPDGSQLAIGTAKIQLWNPVTGSLDVLQRGYGASNLAWAPDGRNLAGSSTTGAIAIWDVASGAIANTITGHPILGRYVMWSDNGRLAVSLDYGGSVDVWNVRTGKTVERYPLRSATALSPDLSRVVAVGPNSRLVVKNLAEDLKLGELEADAGNAQSEYWSPDSGSIAVVRNDLTIYLYDALTFERQVVLRGHSEFIDGLAWAPDSRTVASWSGDGSLRIWDAASGNPIREIALDHRGATEAAWAPDGNRLAVTYSNTLNIWDTATGGLLLTHQDGEQLDGLSTVAWSPDGSRIAAATYSGTIKIYAATEGQLLLTLNGHGGSVESLAWSPDGTELLSGSYVDGTVRIWDVKDTLSAAAVPEASEPAAAAEQPNNLSGKIVFLSSRDYTDFRADMPTNLRPHDIYAINADGSGVRRVTNGLRLFNVHAPAVSPDGSQIIIGGYNRDSGARIFSANGELLRSFSLPGTGGWALDWLPNGKVLFCIFMESGLSEEIYSVDAETGAFTRLTNDSERELFASWSPDGRQIAFMRDYALWVMDADGTGQRQVVEGEARDLDWSPDGTLIAMESSETPGRGMDFEIYLVQPDGMGRRSLTNSPAIILYNPSWSPDGMHLAVESYADYPPREGQISIVDVQTGVLTQVTSTGNNFQPFWAPDS